MSRNRNRDRARALTRSDDAARAAVADVASQVTATPLDIPDRAAPSIGHFVRHTYNELGELTDAA